MNPDTTTGARPAIASSPTAWQHTWILAAVAFLIYLPSFPGGFLWDDDLLITANPLMTDPWGWLRTWIAPPQSQADYFPLSTTVFWIQYQIWGEWAPGYRLLNGLLHAAATLMLFRLLRTLQLRGAWWATLIWAVHPVNAESVAWISELKNTLSLTLAVAAFEQWLHHQRTDRTPHLIRSLLLFLLALSAKTSVVALAPILALHTFHASGGKLPGKAQWLRLTPYFLLALAFGLVAVHFQHTRAMAGESWSPPDLPSRIAAASTSLVFYLSKALVPLNLTTIYPQWQTSPPAVWQLALASLVPLVALACWRFRRSWGAPLAFGLGSYLLALTPMLGFIPMSYHRHSLVADHFQYHALTSLVALIVCGSASFVRSPRLHSIATTTAAAATVTLSCLTWQHARIHQNEESLWLANLAANPRGWHAPYRLGLLHAARGDLAAAAADFKQSIAINPHFAEVHLNLGILHLQSNNRSEAIACFEQAIAVNPATHSAHMNLCVLLLAEDKPQEAARAALRATNTFPADPEILGMAGYIYLKTGNNPSARAVLATAAAAQPNDPLTLTNLAVALHATGHKDEALDQLHAALRIRPDYAPAQRNLTRIHQQQSPLEPADQP